MKRIVTTILLLLVCSLSLTGCSYLFPNTGEGGRDKSVPTDEVLIKQVQDVMKREMDKIGFEVDFSSYTFRVKIVQTFATSGTIFIKDKRYDQPEISIYDGPLDQIDENEIGINPIAFVAHGYQDYVMKTLVNDKNRGNNLDEVLKISGGRVEVDDMHGTGGLSGNKGGTVTGNPGSLETILLPNNLYGYGDYYTCFNYLDRSEYTQLFRGKSASNFDYYEFTENADFIVIVIVLVASNTKNIEELQRKTNTLYNNQYTIFKLVKE